MKRRRHSQEFKKEAVRGSRFRFVNNKELYDISNDPFETSNVIAEFTEAVKAMRSAYDQWWTEMVPLMVNEDIPNSPTRPFFEFYEQQLASGPIQERQPPDLK